MGPLDLLDHLLNFVAPAIAVGVLCAVLGRATMKRSAGSPGLWALAAINFVVGVAVLAAGLVIFGRDGKMETYIALAFACGTSQWLSAGGWRR